MSTNEQNYRPLGPDEVIQEGDEYKHLTSTVWGLCIASTGETPKEWPDLEFRRPIKAIVADLKEKLAESEKKRAEAEQKLQVAVGLACIEDYPKDIANDILAARKEIVELRIRAETAERERDEAREQVRLLTQRTVEQFCFLQEGSELWQAAFLYAEKYNTSSVIVGLLFLREKASSLLTERDRLQAELAKCREAFDSIREILVSSKLQVENQKALTTGTHALLDSLKKQIREISQVAFERAASIKAALEGGK